AAWRQLVERGHGAGDDAWMATRHVADAWAQADVARRGRERSQHDHRFADHQVRVGHPEHVEVELLRQLRGFDDAWRWDVRGEPDAELQTPAHAAPPVVTGDFTSSWARSGMTRLAKRSIERSQIEASVQSVAPMSRSPKPPTAACSSRTLRTTVSGLP